MTLNLPVARLQHWMDLTGVMSFTPWSARPSFIEGVDRPQPQLHLINGGEIAVGMGLASLQIAAVRETGARWLGRSFMRRLKPS